VSVKSESDELEFCFFLRPHTHSRSETN